MFYFLYIIFFISSLLYGSYYIGPATPRQMMTVVMFGYLMMNRGLFVDKYMKTYAVFIFFYVLSSMNSGYTVEAIKSIFSMYLVAYVGYVATTRLFQLKKGYDILLYTIIAVGCLNSLVTICQLLHIEALNNIVNAFHLNEGYDDLISKNSNYSRSEENVFIIAIPGLFQDPVTNGYFSSVAAICALYLPYKKLRLDRFIPWIFLMVGCFASQQRSSLGTAVICSLLAFYFILKYTKEKGILPKLMPLLILACIIYFLSADSLNIVTRYDDLFNMDSRNKLIDSSLEFISENLLLGGIDKFFELYQVYPHNIIFNAVIVGGLFGALPIFIILWKQMKRSITIFRLAPKDVKCIFPIMSLFSIFGASLMHNQSIVYGDFLYWCFASFIVYFEINHELTKKKQMRL